MDGLQNQLIDIGLNTLGYVVAGMLGMVIYSFAGRKKVQPVQIQAAAEPTAAAIAPPMSGTADVADVEFLDLRQQSIQSRQSTKNSSPSASQAGRTAPGKPDRVEIIRLAREMLKAGTPTEMIKRTLPISDGELSLLQPEETSDRS